MSTIPDDDLLLKVAKAIRSFQDSLKSRKALGFETRLRTAVIAEIMEERESRVQAGIDWLAGQGILVTGLLSPHPDEFTLSPKAELWLQGLKV